MEVSLRYEDIRSGLKKELSSSGTAIRIRKAVEAFAEFVYPSDIYCIGCGRPIDPGKLYSMCEECIMKISWANGRVCETCGKPLEDWYPENVCAECSGEERSFSGGVTCFVYRSVVRDMIRRLKYGGESYMGRILGEILAESIAARGYEPELIVPVPMYYKKKRLRGYDQAELIAVSAAEHLGIECRSDALRRKRRTRPMSRLNRQERRHNLEGAFAVGKKGEEAVKGRRVMLIDDIYTTGTTLDCCAEVLMEAGAAEVYAASLAAGINQRNIPDSDIYFHDPVGSDDIDERHPVENGELKRARPGTGPADPVTETWYRTEGDLSDFGTEMPQRAEWDPAGGPADGPAENTELRRDHPAGGELRRMPSRDLNKKTGRF